MGKAYEEDKIGKKNAPHHAGRTIARGAQAGRDEIAPCDQSIEKAYKEEENYAPEDRRGVPEGADDLTIHVLESHVAGSAPTQTCKLLTPPDPG